MKSWTILGAGALIGAAVTLTVVAGNAYGTTQEEARIAALEARIATLESSIRVVSIRNNISTTITTDKVFTVESKQKINLNAADEILLTTGKASLRMRKSGEIVLNGTDISVSGTTVNMKDSSDAAVKGAKVLQN